MTNVLEPSDLTDETASQLYQLRWGIELQFRAIKQTFLHWSEIPMKGSSLKSKLQAAVTDR